MPLLRALLVEDSTADAVLITRELRRGGFEVISDVVDSAPALHRAMREGQWDLVISDYRLPSFDGLAALQIVRQVSSDMPFVLVSGAVGEETVVDAVKAGANDYVMKDNLKRLPIAVERELREVAQRREAAEERERLLAQLHQSQKLEAIGTLAGGVAHDFNNLLVVIRGNAELALEASSEGEELRSELREILEASTRAQRLIQQLLLFSRRRPTQTEAAGVDAIVDDISSLLNRLLDERISVVVQHAGEQPLVNAERGLIEQVVVNLVTNARDAMPGGGEIRIRTECVEVSRADALRMLDARAGSFARITVEDTGEGIEAELLPLIFDPFFTTKPAGKGTGLGLATVYGVARDHGGWVTVESEPGRGTTFSIYLPVAEVPVEAPATSPAKEAADVGRHRVLVVEDDASVRALVATILSRHGHEVVRAATCADAVSEFERADGQFDLVISDVVLPDGTGPNTLRQLRSLAPDLRAILASGYAADTLQLDVGDERGIRYLCKPYGPAELLREVSSVMAGAV